MARKVASNKFPFGKENGQKRSILGYFGLFSVDFGLKNLPNGNELENWPKTHFFSLLYKKIINIYKSFIGVFANRQVFMKGGLL